MAINFDISSWAALEPAFNQHIESADPEAARRAASALWAVVCRGAPARRGLPPEPVAGALLGAMRRHPGHEGVQGAGCFALYRLCGNFPALRASLQRDPAVLRTVRHAATVRPYVEGCGFYTSDLCDLLQPQAEEQGRHQSGYQVTVSGANSELTDSPQHQGEPHLAPAVQQPAKEAPKVEGLRPGGMVQVKGLKSDAALSLNGEKGVLESWNAATNRWNVRLRSGEVKSIRAENLLEAFDESPIKAAASEAEKSVKLEPGHGARLGMFSARFNEKNKDTENKFRAVYKLLLENHYDVMMVDAGASESFGKLTAQYLNRLNSEKGIMLAVCTSDYGEMTDSPYSSFAELEYAQEYKVDVLPLQVEQQWKPNPPCGEGHQDTEKLALAYISMVFKPSCVRIDCRNKAIEKIASEIAAVLRKGRPA